MTRPLDPLTKLDRQIRRCPACAGWTWRGRPCTACHRQPRTDSRPATQRMPGLPDDGIIDPIAVERLLAETLHWLDATPSERLEAGRIAMRREGGYAFCESVLHLGPRAIRRLRDEVRVERVAS